VIRQFRIALSFLTRLPAGNVECAAEDIGRSARWFPLVGGVLGAIYVGAAKLLGPFFPPLITAVLICAVDAFLTGAMHFDGLADTADGFGGGRTSEDVLRIMRDHSIGSYGACALFLAFALKIAALAALINTTRALPALLLAPALGRWTAVFSSAIGGYARPVKDDSSRSVGSPTRYIGRIELVVASLITAAFAFPHPWRGGAVWLLAALAAGAWTARCRRRIGGVTGDTLGAGVEMAECLVLVAYAANF
jgi:cobalamin 5'-phosphate synthase/cobalamin synthase